MSNRLPKPGETPHELIAPAIVKRRAAIDARRDQERSEGRGFSEWLKDHPRIALVLGVTALAGVVVPAEFGVWRHDSPETHFPGASIVRTGGNQSPDLQRVRLQVYEDSMEDQGSVK